MKDHSSAPTTDSAPPYLTAAPARFIEADSQSVYTLVGAVLELAEPAGEGQIHVLVAPDAVRKYAPQFMPVFEFFRIPREEHQVREWLAWAGGDDRFLEGLISTGSVVRLDTREPLSAVESLQGIRIAPQCGPVGLSPHAPGIVNVAGDQTDGSHLAIPFELGEVLWGGATDVPSAVVRVQHKFGLPKDVAARRVLSDIPLLLLHGYARLEWIKAPRA